MSLWHQWLIRVSLVKTTTSSAYSKGVLLSDIIHGFDTIPLQHAKVTSNNGLGSGCFSPSPLYNTFFFSSDCPYYSRMSYVEERTANELHDWSTNSLCQHLFPLFWHTPFPFFCFFFSSFFFLFASSWENAWNRWEMGKFYMNTIMLLHRFYIVYHTISQLFVPGIPNIRHFSSTRPAEEKFRSCWRVFLVAFCNTWLYMCWMEDSGIRMEGEKVGVDIGMIDLESFI